MKEMVYQSTRLNPPVVLDSGEYNGYNYYVLNLGTHPCGYVEIPSGKKYFNVDYNYIPVECHGGLTYGRGYLHTVAEIDDNRYFIGWDYAHYGDYVGYDSKYGIDSEFKGAVYYTEEIVRECKNVINQLIKLEQEAEDKCADCVHFDECGLGKQHPDGYKWRFEDAVNALIGGSDESED